MACDAGPLNPDQAKLVFFAPNVHVGGGLVLLRAFMSGWPPDEPCRAFLDRRAASHLAVPPSWSVVWCDRTLLGFLKAERALQREGRPNRVIFTFHSLPPLFPVEGKVVTLVHNTYVIGQGGKGTSQRMRFRLALEMGVFSLFQGRISKFLVQTPSLARALARRLSQLGRQSAMIEVAPFLDPAALPSVRSARAPWVYDFVYVSDGAPHKNHRRLFEAWRLLAGKGLLPSLCVTLSADDTDLLEMVEDLKQRHGVRIVNLGRLPHAEAMKLYDEVGAAIFPSVSETFGLPLIEADAAGAPILASELDFVRDVCRPVETFDPRSATSIARAVERYFNVKRDSAAPLDPAAFCEYVLATAESPESGRSGDSAVDVN